MDHFEEELRKALTRQEPSTYFAARVLSCVAQEQRREPWWRRWIAVPQLRWAAAMALVIAVLGASAIYEHEQRQRMEGEAAKQQVMLALRIAGQKMQVAKAHVQDLSER
jgi:hypothetical protein